MSFVVIFFFTLIRNQSKFAPYLQNLNGNKIEKKMFPFYVVLLRLLAKKYLHDPRAQSLE